MEWVGINRVWADPSVVWNSESACTHKIKLPSIPQCESVGFRRRFPRVEGGNGGEKHRQSACSWYLMLLYRNICEIPIVIRVTSQSEGKKKACSHFIGRHPHWSSVWIVKYNQSFLWTQHGRGHETDWDSNMICVRVQHGEECRLAL